MWVYGDLIHSGGKYYIHPKGNLVSVNGELGRIIVMHEVIPDTICQYTGLTDKNGNKIWENDVVFVTDDDGNSGQVDTGIGEIDFLEGLWYISGSVQNSLYDINKCFQIEVIGNVFDNPELVGGEVE